MHFNRSVNSVIVVEMEADVAQGEQDTAGFKQLFGLAQFVGILLLVLTAVWTGHFLGGFGFQENPDLEFNWHPMLMVLALIYMYGNGLLVYRVFRNQRKIGVKLAHTAMMLTVFVMTVLALKAVFDSHNLPIPPLPNMYSLHSWTGIITVALFAMQFVCGLVTFLIPGLANDLRIRYLPLHQFFGMCIFVLACATALMGITEKAFESELSPEGFVVNWIGLLIVIFSAIVIFLATNPSYRRGGHENK